MLFHSYSLVTNSQYQGYWLRAHGFVTCQSVKRIDDRAESRWIRFVSPPKLILSADGRAAEFGIARRDMWISGHGVLSRHI